MTGVFLTPMAWYAQHRKDHLGQLFFYLPNPSVLPELGTAIIVTSAFLTLLYMTIESLKQHASLPRGLYILSIGIQPIFGTISYPIYHLAIFGICHWLIEFALASRILHSQSLAAESRLPAPPQRILRPGFSMWVLVFTLLSVLMYCIFHSRTLHGIVGIGLQSGYNQDSLFAYKTGISPWSFGALSGAYFGISFVHFAYDRYLFKHQTVDNASPRL